MNLDALTLRQLQTESAKALTILEATNSNISQFNKESHHDSQKWYRSVISWYIQKFGDLPSKAGPAKDIKLLTDV